MPGKLIRFYGRPRTATRVRHGRRGGGSIVSFVSPSKSVIRTRRGVYRRGRRGTITKTKTRLNQKARIDPNGHVSYSGIHITPKLKKQFLAKSVDKATGDQSVCYNNRGSLGPTGLGVQTWTQLGGTEAVPGWMTAADHINLMLAAGSQSATTQNVNTMKIFVKEMIGEVMYTNVSNTSCHMQLYDCVARVDITDDNKADPGVTWNTSSSEMTNYNPQVVGTTPFSSSLFTKLWRVVKITDVALSPGASHVHKVRYNINRFISNELVQMYSTLSAQHGITYHTMAIIHGYPFFNGGSTNVTLGSAEIAYVYKKQFIFKEVLGNRDTNYTVNNLTQSGTERAIAAPMSTSGIFLQAFEP